MIPQTSRRVERLHMNHYSGPLHWLHSFSLIFSSLLYFSISLSLFLPFYLSISLFSLFGHAFLTVKGEITVAYEFNKFAIREPLFTDCVMALCTAAERPEVCVLCMRDSRRCLDGDGVIGGCC